jgi:hypothetical protein
LYVNVEPVKTGSGESDFVIARSAAPVATVVVAVPLSLPGFGSEVDEEAVAVFERTVPGATLGATATVKVNTALPVASDGFEQDMVPPDPTPGVVQDHPTGEDNELKVVPEGRVSDSETDAAELGPELVTVMV